MDLRIVVHSEAVTSPAAGPHVASIASAGRTGLIGAEGASSRVSLASLKTHRTAFQKLLIWERDEAAALEGDNTCRAMTRTLKHKSSKSLRTFLPRHPSHATQTVAGHTVKHKSSKSLRTFLSDTPNLFTSHASKVVIPSSSQESRALVLRRVPGLFVPSLPSELWLLILRFAAYPPYLPLPSTSHATPAYSHPFPYQTEYDPDVALVSFLDLPTPHDHRHERRVAYKDHLRRKAALAQVCRAWNAIAQEIIYEFIWISSGRQGRALAEKLCGDGVDMMAAGAVISVGGKERERGLAWPWKGRQRRGSSATTETTVIHRKSSSHSLAPPSLGRYVKRLHVETPPLDQCSPHDLLLILQHCPNLDEYCDLKSVRRPMHPLILSLSDVAPFSVSTNPLLTPDALLHTLFSRPLKHLTWTNYDYDPTNYNAGVRLYEEFLTPRLEAVGGSLEFLEIVLSQTSAFGMGGRAEVGWAVGGASSATLVESTGSRGERDSVTDIRVPLTKNPSVGMYGAANLLTSLEASFTQTTTTVSTLACPVIDPLQAPTLSIDGFACTLTLPALRSLKATLDNATFHILSMWDMPVLTHLSVLSADFSYAGAGFRKFFEVHGMKLHQLELGHSSGDIEEAWLTDPPRRGTSTTAHGISNADENGGTGGYGPEDPHEGIRIPLDAWCPNLTHFICSADAEWNWQRPDWIAPHVFLPTHEGLRFIGVRGMERRLVGDLDEALRRRGRDAGTVTDVVLNDAYFALLQQFGSIMSKAAFPKLTYVRDMSWESDIMRSTGRMWPLPPAAAATAVPNAPCSMSGPYLSPLDLNNPAGLYGSSHSGSTGGGLLAAARRLASKSKPAADDQAQVQAARREAEDALARNLGRRVNGFWREVLGMCRESGVWLEDCRGVNITVAGLNRAVR